MSERQKQRRKYLAALRDKMAARCALIGGSRVLMKTVVTPLRLHRHRSPVPTLAAADRDRELRGINGLLHHALEVEKQQVALLLGSPGAGKTTLLADYCRRRCMAGLRREPIGSPPGESRQNAPYLPIWLPCTRLNEDHQSLAEELSALSRANLSRLKVGEKRPLWALARSPGFSTRGMGTRSQSPSPFRGDGTRAPRTEGIAPTRAVAPEGAGQWRFGGPAYPGLKPGARCRRPQGALPHPSRREVSLLFSESCVISETSG
jgi:hypothetical protein